MPGQIAYRKPYGPIADKVLAQSYPEASPMVSTAQTAQEQRPANLAALQQSLKELAAKSSAPTTKGRPIVVQGPVMVVRGK